VQRTQKIKNLASVLSKTQKNVIFGLEANLECMFYHDNTVAYLHVPEKKIVDSLSQLNYKILIAHTSDKDTFIKYKNNIYFIAW
jgi:hypothetical protein